MNFCGPQAGSAPPSRPGTTPISAHRDTHFKRITDIQPGGRIELETSQGNWTYRVLYTDVIDARHTVIGSDPLHDELVLVTRYPFAGCFLQQDLSYLSINPYGTVSSLLGSGLISLANFMSLTRQDSILGLHEVKKLSLAEIGAREVRTPEASKLKPGTTQIGVNKR